MLFKNFFIYLSVILIHISCDQTSNTKLNNDNLPDVDFARKAKENEFYEANNGIFKIVEFKKKNGFKQDFYGMEVYTMEIIYKIKFTCDAYSAPGWSQKYVINKKTALENISKPLPYVTKLSQYIYYKKDTIVEIDNDKMIFHKKENGWEYTY